MSYYTDPWHTLKVEATYFHDDPLCQAAIDADGDCPGHNDKDDTIREQENAYKVAHPEECGKRTPECWTERSVIDGDYEDLLGGLATGTYRVRMSGGSSSTPDGEDYDEEMTIEEAAA